MMVQLKISKIQTNLIAEFPKEGFSRDIIWSKGASRAMRICIEETIQIAADREEVRL